MSWSQTEKAVARRAFNLALRRELDAVIQETKDRAGRIEKPEELWDLERYLTQRRREIDDKYDYRYSVLLLVFARLICEGRLSASDLHGLDEDKLERIRHIVNGARQTLDRKKQL
jgi:hypothetical protein